jgi:hypothetical protein
VRVALTNSYPMDEALSLVQSGSYPAQHLWGMWELRDGFSWIIASQQRSGRRQPAPLARARAKLMPFVGDVGQQLRAFRSTGAHDIVYAADQKSCALLCALRRGGLVRRHVVVMVHNGPRLRWTKFWLRGADVVLCLSETVAARLEAEIGRPVRVMPWGPSDDCDLYEDARSRMPAPEARPYDFVAAGKTNRQYAGLHEAARHSGLSGVIFDGEAVTTYTRGSMHREVRSTNYREIIDAMIRSRAVVIPVADVERLSGLTEIADALALGLPYLLTRGANVPEGMRRAAIEIDSESPQEIARTLAEVNRRGEPPAEGPTMRAFAAALGEIFEDLAAGRR